MRNTQNIFLDHMFMGHIAKRSVVLPPSKVPPLHEVFAETILDENPAHQRRSPLDWAVSIVLHALILATLLIVPLFFDQGFDMYRYNLTFLAAPMPPAGPPPPPISSSVAQAVRAAPKAFTPGRLMAPSFIPKVVATIVPGDIAPPESILGGVPGGVPGGMPGGQLGGVLGGVLGGMNVAPPPELVREGPKKPVVIGGDLKPPRLISGPMPDYPVLARQSRIFGTVLVEAIIDEHGNVIEVRAVRGHPLLIPAALKAVSLRKYEPTILDGQPTPVDLRVDVKFSLS